MSTYKDTILVTGGTTGLGYFCALNIARDKPNSLIIVASRSNQVDAATKINTALQQSNVIYMPLDLSNRDGVRKFVAEITSKNYAPFSALVLNAGLQFPGGVEYNSEGIEKTFAVNHVGHALLLFLLMPHLKTDARIVLTSSGTHDPAMKTGLPDAEYSTAEELAHPTEKTKQYQGRQRYATSKLCNVLYTYALDRHFKDGNKKWTVTALDPGLMPGTGLARDAGMLLRFVWHYILPSLVPMFNLFTQEVHRVETSGANLARLAVSDEVKGVSGKYIKAREEFKSSDVSYDIKKQEDLYSWTAKYVTKSPEELQRFLHLT